MCYIIVKKLIRTTTTNLMVKAVMVIMIGYLEKSIGQINVVGR